VWLASAAWMAVIALESTNLGSAENTSRILYPIFRFVFDINAAQFAVLHHLLRKIGHFVGYFTLSVLLFRSWSVTFSKIGMQWCMQWASLAFFNTALVASLDEWHQNFLPSRTGHFSDVVLDSIAGLAAQIAIFLMRRFQAAKMVEAEPADVMLNDQAEQFTEFQSEQHR
jgi:VanZ family protein